MGPRERRLVLLLLALAVLGQGGRFLLAPPTPGELLLPTGTAPGSAREARRAAADLARPLASGETIDPNRASAAELTRLPGVGMRLAKEIVADREIRGPFGSAEALDRVDGIGPAAVRRLKPLLRFEIRDQAGPQPVVLNRASAEELDRLPGLGQTRVAAILAYRERHGPFADLADLERVPGISRRLAAQLAKHLTLN